MQFCGITCDNWLSLTTESYMGVTCHYINEDWQLISRVIALKHLTDDHNADYLYETLFNILCEWNILAKVVASVSDSGANIVCALKRFSFPNYPCAAHRLNLCVNDILKVHFKYINFVNRRYFSMKDIKTTNLKQIINKFKTF